MELTEDVRRINGVEVHFPYKPYPSQISMMAKIIAGLKNKQNCLLESPTGSGKSLALLCSALAWQETQQELAHKEELERSEIENGVCTCSFVSFDTSCTANQSLPVVSPHFPTKLVPQIPNLNQGAPVSVPQTTLPNQTAPPARMVSLLSTQNQTNTSCNEDDDFKDSNKKFRTPGSNQVIPRVPIKIQYENQAKPTTIKFLSRGADGQLKEETKTIIFLPHLPGQNPGIAQAVNQGQATPHVNQTRPLVPGETPSNVLPQNGKVSGGPCPNCKAREQYTNPPKRKIPKIYFGTRTHKQIAQIIRELRKTHYKYVKMTILASREHTCIHPTVSRSSSKSEGCKDLRDGPGCSFNLNSRKLSSQNVVKNYFGTDTAWDIEDLVAMCTGKKVRACPYYVSRGLRLESDIVFCPYNYLVDPIIRKTMEINLKEEIIILDEGHNIEDSARESVSKSIELDSVTKMIRELEDLVKKEVKPYEHHILLNMCSRLDQFIRDTGSQLENTSNFDQASTVWAGMDIVARLVAVGLGPKDFPELTRVLAAVTEEPESEKQRDGGMPTPRISVVSANVLEALFMMLDFLYRDDMRFVQDYRVAIVRSTSFSQPMNDTSDRWLTARKKGKKQLRQVFTLNFWCLNPAVAFSDFTVVRNLILTSGTLSPMSSFSSELGMSFPISLEANHVIKDSQVWVGSIGEGPGGGKLQATYRNTETYEFQDELGRLVLEVCKTVPHGILCFLPSYKMLEKLSTRWQTTGLWREILQRKKIISEPRRGDKADFDDLLKYFYSVINGDLEEGSDYDEEEDGESSVDGALFLAVCRGKVSEGLDFADNNARAVITVGIPFPNVKDTQVELKRKYNDKYCSERGLLSGSDWYEIQAYRALNQALGRCIRHRNDWGALIMIDDRFVRQPQKYIKGLSKWVRNKACTFSTFRHAIGSLKNFTQVRLKASETDTSNISSLPTSQTDNSALETPQKLNGSSKTEECVKGNNQYDLITPSKPVTSTPFSNQFKIRPPTSTPISNHSPPMSLPNKDIDFGSNGLIDISTESVTPVVKKENGTHKSKHVDKSAKDGVNKFFKFFNISDQNCSSNSSNLTVQEDVTLAGKHTNNSYDFQNKKSTVNKDSNSVVKTGNVLKEVKKETSENEKEVDNNPTNGKEECNEDCSKTDITNDEEFLMSTPNLFESDMSEPEEENVKDDEKCRKNTPDSKPVAKRPLFRRAATKACKLMKSWINSDEDDNDFKTDKKLSDSLLNGKSNCENKRRKSSDRFNDSSKDDGNESCEKNGAGDQNEEDNLKTRRNQRGRKRKGLGKAHQSNKRSKGVDFLDDCNQSNDTSKETDQIPDNSLSCSKCGCVLVTSIEGREKRRRAPAFVQNILGKRNSEFLFITSGEISHKLKPVSHVLEEKVTLRMFSFTHINPMLFAHRHECNKLVNVAKGDNLAPAAGFMMTGCLVLNSSWCETDQCCVEYFSCLSCSDQSKLTAARIILTGEQCHFKTGMMWLLANTVT